MTDDEKVTIEERRTQIAAWKAIVAEYQQRSLWRAWWQIVNTLGSYVAVWGLMYLSLEISWWERLRRRVKRNSPPRKNC